jgi:short-subunit dehydrogenase
MNTISIPKKATILITGASSGIGSALAKRLSKEGYHLGLAGRDQQALEELQKSLPGKTTLLIGNLALAADRHAITDWIHSQGPSIVINNAGFGAYGDPLKEENADLFLDMVEVNIQAVLEITLETAHHWKRTGQKGIILNVASIVAFIPFPGMSVYSCTKLFVKELSSLLDWEWRGRGIRVLCACPGPVFTAFHSRASHGRLNKKPLGAITADRAAEIIWQQIQSGRACCPVGKLAHIAYWIGGLVPRALKNFLLKARI